MKRIMPEPTPFNLPAAGGRPLGSEVETRPVDHSHTLIRETILQIAQERELFDPGAGATLFTVIETCSALRRHLVGVVAAEGLSEAKFCALTVLHRLHPEPTTAAELAYHTGVSRSAMTDILDQLVAQGWVERERSQNDRRTVRIGLTPEGWAVGERAVKALIGASADLLRGISAATLAQLDAFCGVINGRLDQPVVRPDAPTLTRAASRDRS